MEGSPDVDQDVKNVTCSHGNAATATANLDKSAKDVKSAVVPMPDRQVALQFDVLVSSTRTVTSKMATKHKRSVFQSVSDEPYRC